jgi:glycosyltransferase involved in cell wall biosynthesis
MTGAEFPGERVTIVVPVFNEEATVGAVVDRLLAMALPIPREILVVNDGSTDGTRGVLDALPANAALRIVHAHVNGGKGRAIRTGFEEARGTIVAIQDADLELDPTEIAALLQPILERRTGVVYGSRFLRSSRGVPGLTVAANWFLTGLTNLLYGASLTDMETCFKVMRTEIARALRLEANRFDIEPEITAKLLRAGHQIVELPVHFEPRSRAQGKKIGWRDGIAAIAVLVRQRFRA